MFVQSLFKRLCTLGLKKDYLEKDEVQKWFKAVFCFALIPIDKVEQEFDKKQGRTNNRVEGDNNRMKLFCGAADPKIDKAVTLLQHYESTASDKYENAKKADARLPL